MRTSAQHPSNSQDGGPWEVIQFPRFERQKVFYFYFSNLKSKDKSKVRKQRTRRSARLVLVAEVLKIVLGFKQEYRAGYQKLVDSGTGYMKAMVVHEIENSFHFVSLFFHDVCMEPNHLWAPPSTPVTTYFVQLSCRFMY